MCHRTINQHVELAYLDPGINNHYLAQKKSILSVSFCLGLTRLQVLCCVCPLIEINFIFCQNERYRETYLASQSGEKSMSLCLSLLFAFYC